MKIPYKVKKKMIKNWHLGYIDYSNQDADFHKRLKKHLSGSKNFAGEYRGVYYFQFDKPEKVEIFLSLIQKKLKELNIRTI